VPRLWYLRRQGRVTGPFPTGAIIQDWLVGRVSAEDELSPDREEWRAFDFWPELASALAAAPAAAAAAEPQWLLERAKARLRWADERSGPDPGTGHEDTQVPSDRRTAEPQRGGPQSADAGSRSPLRPRARFANERAILKIVAVLAIAAALIALLTWLYGPVNPVPVRIR
jgi:hypothetical protein